MKSKKVIILVMRKEEFKDIDEDDRLILDKCSRYIKY